jgi:ATP-binding cassette subfamily B protein
LQRISFRFFDTNETGSIINRVTGDVQSVRLFVDGVILQTVVLVLSVGVYLSYMLHINAKLTLACLASTPLLVISTWIYLEKRNPPRSKTRALSDVMVRTLSENIQGIQVVKGFAREEEEVAKFAQANSNLREQQNWTFWLTSVFTPVSGLIPQLNLVVLLCYGGYLLANDPTFTLGQGIIVFAGLLRQFRSAGFQHRYHRQQRAAKSSLARNACLKFWMCPSKSRASRTRFEFPTRRAQSVLKA